MMRSLSAFILMLLLVLPSHAQEALPFKKGETVKYAVKKGFIKAGDATLTFQGQGKLNDGSQEVYLIVFKADGFNFYDEEKIFVDVNTFRPVAVVRDLNIFGNKEYIVEEYFSDKGEIKITKEADGKTTVETIKKSGEIDNIYGAIYRYRAKGSFKIGDQMALRLPTQDVTLKLVKTEKIDDRDAYYMESVPAKYKVWFDTSAKKTPLRITGASGFGKTTMFMTEYKE